MGKAIDKQLELQEKITKLNNAYRKGSSIVDDSFYDFLVDKYIELFGDDDFINQVGFEDEADDRMEDLPIIMGSLNKIKTFKEYQKWLISKKIPSDTLLVCTPKYDGLSFCTDENTNKAWTRGNGIKGQRSDEHFKIIGTSCDNYDAYCYGEVIMRRSIFNEKYANEFANPRNMVSGQLNQKVPSNSLADCDYIRYGVEFYDNTQLDKIEQLNFCNKLNKIKVPYRIFKANELTINDINKMFIEWSKDYEIDGIVIDINSIELRQLLGRETSKLNPAYARAFKGNFEEVKETTCVDIIYQVSKTGRLVPVCKVEPVNCDGAIVTAATLYNASTVVDLGIAPGSRVKIKRSGMVIPKIIEVITPIEAKLPTYCPECGKELVWNETDIDLMCINPDCPAIRMTRLYAFFKIIGADNFSEGTINTFVEAGYTSIKDILSMTTEQMVKIDRIGKRKAEKIYEGIHSKLQNISLPVLQHASGFFQGLGSKKLALVEKALQEFDFLTHSKNPIHELVKIDGFSTKSANIYLQGINLFNEWVKDLPCIITEPEKEPEVTGTLFKDEVVVFSGYRNSDAEKRIIAEGGIIGKKVNKKTTLLVMKSKGSGTSKEQDALVLGVKIVDKDEFEKMLNSGKKTF